MLDELDALIEEAMVYGELSAGTPAHWLNSHADPRMVSGLAATTKARDGKAADWTPAEELFVKENFRTMSDAEIGKALGRTRTSVLLYRRRYLKSVTRRSDPQMPTARAAARLLGLGCAKSITRLILDGILPAIELPMDMHMWGIPRYALIRFAVNPENWIYFKPNRVTDPHIRRLVQLRQARWADEWWTPGQVAAYHGVTVNGIGQCIRRGRLPAKRWGNWWIKRSDAIALKITSGKGKNEALNWTDAADAFLILARALGFSWTAINDMCHWPRSRSTFRLEALHERNAIPRLIKAHNLAVAYDRTSGNLFADWRDYRHKFPRLTTAIARFRDGQSRPEALPEGTRSEGARLHYVAHTLQTWAQWHAKTDAQRYTAYCIRHGMYSVETLQDYHAELQTWGIEPLLAQWRNPSGGAGANQT